MSIRHHVSSDLLVQYAAGRLAEGWCIAIATHLAMCPDCRDRLLRLEAVAGALVDELEPVEGPQESWERLQARVAGAGSPVKTPAPAALPSGELPQPLRSYVGNLADIRWRSLGNARQVLIKTGDLSTQVRLLRIAAGKPVPEHSHGGRELTLVLKGSFHDEVDNFGPGDIEDADGELTHQPIAGREQDCICLAVTDAPLRFRSRLIRLLQPFLGI